MSATTAPTALLTAMQAADRLGISDRGVLMVMQRGALPAAGRRGRAWLFDAAAVDAYAAAHRPATVGRCDQCGDPLPRDRPVQSRYCRPRCRQLAFYARHGITEGDYLARYRGRA